MKKCKICKQLLPLEQFSKNKNTKDGLHYICKQCVKHKSKKYVKKNM
jgi:superfamily II helicase